MNCRWELCKLTPSTIQGIHAKSSRSFGQMQQMDQEQQRLIIQPIEFDYRHRNVYGYLALATFILVLINFIMLKERACQYSLANGSQDYDTIQAFHLTTIIIGIIVFILSYFNFALVIADIKLLFYASALLIFACAGFLIYSAVVIFSAPCVPTGYLQANQFFQQFDTSFIDSDTRNVFAARDAIGITVFIFDIIGAGLMFLAGRRFYQKY